MKKLLPLLLVILLSCDDNKNDQAKHDLDRMGQDVKKGFEESKVKIKEAVREVKHDTTIKKIGEEVKNVGNRSSH